VGVKVGSTADATFTRFEIWRVFTVADIGIPPPPNGKNGMPEEFWKDFDLYLPGAVLPGVGERHLQSTC
jgi:hypothetical protein